MHNMLFCILMSFLAVSGGSIPDMRGRRFVVTYIESLYQSRGSIQLIFSSSTEAYVTVANSLYNIQESVLVPAGDSVTLTLPLAIIPNHDQTMSIEKRALYVESTSDVSVYAFNLCPWTSSSFVVMPIAALGRRHFLASYGNALETELPTFSVAAVSNNTDVTIKFRVGNSGSCGTPSGGNASIGDGDVHNFVLDEFDVFTAYCSGDVTGTSVVGSKPLGVFSGHVGGSIPIMVAGKDTFAEMMPPVEMYGRRYVLHGAYLDRAATIRVLASEDNTAIILSNGDHRTLSLGQILEIDLNVLETMCLEASKPVLVLMYGLGLMRVPHRMGDPFMIIVPPVERYSNDFPVYLNMHTSYTTHVSLVLKTPYTNQLPAEFNVAEVPSCRYSVAYAAPTTGILAVNFTEGITYAAFFYSYKHAEGNGLSMGSARQPHNSWAICDSNPCLNNGTCTDGLFNFTCSCGQYYTGPRCEERILTDLSTTTVIDAQTGYDTQTGYVTTMTSGSQLTLMIAAATTTIISTTTTGLQSRIILPLLDIFTRSPPPAPIAPSSAASPTATLQPPSANSSPSSFSLSSSKSAAAATTTSTLSKPTTTFYIFIVVLHRFSVHSWF